jgi:hypothetical protein
VDETTLPGKHKAPMHLLITARESLESLSLSLSLSGMPEEEA